MNLITDRLLTHSDRASATLPGLLAALASGEVSGFQALRAHQRPAWHMFLVQLGALAAWTAKLNGLPEDEASWASALRSLTPQHPGDEPWSLIVEDWSKPAFMQPADPGGLKWSATQTPDDLDLLITSRNHDLKQEIGHGGTPEDWLLALVSLQTCEGFGGRSNYGVARMNGGHSSRPTVSLAPTKRRQRLTVDPSAWWRRDVLRLLAGREAGQKPKAGTVGGEALLWVPSWEESEQIEVSALDPWFIEVCRRIRLVKSQDGLCAMRATSKASRVFAKAFNGNLGDPWAPVHINEGRSFTLSERDFDYALLYDLLFSGTWDVPLLARPDADDAGDMLLVAEALSRGNNKTWGFKSRTVLVQGKALRMFASQKTAKIAEAQMAEIKAFDTALRDALALASAGGDWNNWKEKAEPEKKKHYAHAGLARKQFKRQADSLFFPSLWRRSEASVTQGDEAYQAKRSFLLDLKRSAEGELEAALPGVPCPSIFRPRAEARARSLFVAKLRGNEKVGDSLFKNKEGSHATA